jgi:hypothetical protein
VRLVIASSAFSWDVIKQFKELKVLKVVAVVIITSFEMVNYWEKSFRKTIVRRNSSQASFVVFKVKLFQFP